MKRYLLLLLLFLSSCSNQTSPAWHWKLDSRAYSPPLISQNTAFVISRNGTVIAGQLATGEQIWTVPLKEEVVAGPAVSDDSLLVGSHNGTIYSLDRKNGKINWKKNFPEGFEAPLAADGDLLIAPTVKGTLLAIAIEDGSLRWSISGNQKFSAPAKFHGAAILIGNWNNDFLSINREDGAVFWRFRAAEKVVEECLVHQNTVFVPARDHFVYALDTQTGRLLWRCASNIPTGLSLVDENLVFASGDNILTVQLFDGHVLKNAPLKPRIERIYVVNKQVLAVSDKGQIQELDLRSQKSRTFIPQNFSAFRLANANGQILITSRTETVYAFPYLPGQ